MDKKLSITILLTIGAIVMAICLFAVTILYKGNPTLQSASSGATVSTPVKEKEAVLHPGAKIFEANCKTCHRIDQKLIGPPLAGVLDRRDSLWVVRMIRNSSALIASGDPTAVALFNQYNKTTMTSFGSFSDQDLRHLLEFLRIESKPRKTPKPAPSQAEV